MSEQGNEFELDDKAGLLDDDVEGHRVRHLHDDEDDVEGHRMVGTNVQPPRTQTSAAANAEPSHRSNKPRRG